jgi:enoyl-CoA hydratase
MPLVHLTSDGPVRTITLDDADRRNALSWPLLDELKAAIEAVAADSEARVLVVTGAGKAFCAGADLVNLFGDLDRPVEDMRDHLMKVYGSFLGLRDLSIPTVAAVQGAAVGAGLNIALACDVIVAGPMAGFGPTFSQIGLHPGGGCTWMLTQRIGAANTTAALYAGDIIDAETALRLGIAQELCDNPAARASEMAQIWSAREPKLMADVKQSVRLATTSDASASLEFEALAQAESMANEQFRTFTERFASR